MQRRQSFSFYLPVNRKIKEIICQVIRMCKQLLEMFCLLELYFEEFLEMVIGSFLGIQN